MHNDGGDGFLPEQVNAVVFNSTNVECMSLGDYCIKEYFKDKYL